MITPDVMIGTFCLGIFVRTCFYAYRGKGWKAFFYCLAYLDIAGEIYDAWKDPKKYAGWAKQVKSQHVQLVVKIMFLMIALMTINGIGFNQGGINVSVVVSAIINVVTIARGAADFSIYSLSRKNGYFKLMEFEGAFAKIYQILVIFVETGAKAIIFTIFYGYVAGFMIYLGAIGAIYIVFFVVYLLHYNYRRDETNCSTSMGSILCGLLLGFGAYFFCRMGPQPNHLQIMKSKKLKDYPTPLAFRDFLFMLSRLPLRVFEIIVVLKMKSMDLSDALPYHGYSPELFRIACIGIYVIWALHAIDLIFFLVLWSTRNEPRYDTESSIEMCETEVQNINGKHADDRKVRNKRITTQGSIEMCETETKNINGKNAHDRNPNNMKINNQRQAEIYDNEMKNINGKNAYGRKPNNKKKNDQREMEIYEIEIQNKYKKGTIEPVVNSLEDFGDV